MKTQIFKTRIITAILTILIIAIATPQALAQRRDGNKPSQTKKEYQISEKKVKTRQDTKLDFNKTAKRESNRDQKGLSDNKRYEKTNNTSKNNQNKGYRDNDRDKYKNRNWKHNNTPIFHANSNHRSERYYSWHRNNHISFRHLPHKAVWVLIDGENYAFYRNRFYLPGPFGYFRVTPPVYLHNLPEGCLNILVDNKPMWNYHGIFFLETPFGFKIIV